MDLNEKEKKFIQHYYNLYKSYVFFLVVFIIMGILYYYFIFYKLIPNYLKPIENYQNAKVLISSGLTSIARLNTIWISILFGILIGNWITYVKIKKILRKIIK